MIEIELVNLNIAQALINHIHPSPLNQLLKYNLVGFNWMTKIFEWPETENKIFK